MESDRLLLGYYAANAHTKKGSPLNEVEATEDNVRWLSGRAGICPYKKSDGIKYKEWKSENIPLLFFTEQNTRPDKDKDTVKPSKFCCIDIDNTTDKIEIKHHSVFAVNYTSNGVHILAHSNGVWGSTAQSWRNVYDSLAYAIQSELKGKYGVVKFDPALSDYYWGCYIWNTEWVFNENFDPDFVHVDSGLSNEDVANLYDKPRGKAKNAKVGAYYSQKDIKDAETLGFSNGVVSDLFRLSYDDFLKEYRGRFEVFSDDKPVFKPLETVDGSTYDMCRTNGSLVKFWIPLYSKGFGGRIPKGGRTRSIMMRATSTARYSGDSLDRDRVLYDAVVWYVQWCGRDEELSKKDLLRAVEKGISNRRMDLDFIVDRRKFISGEYMVDKGTGELISMTKGLKISANNKARRTDRVLEMLDVWDNSRSFDENVANAMKWLGVKKRETILKYLQDAKSNKGYLLQYPFLESIEIKSDGRSREVSVLDLRSLEVLSFKSVSECMRALDIKSKVAFSRFKKGKTKLNKRYKIISKSLAISDKPTS